jgi:hypothetical protein
MSLGRVGQKTSGFLFVVRLGSSRFFVLDSRRLFVKLVSE